MSPSSAVSSQQSCPGHGGVTAVALGRRAAAVLAAFVAVAGLVAVGPPVGAEEATSDPPGGPADIAAAVEEVAGEVDQTAEPDEIGVLRRRIDGRLEVLQETVQTGEEVAAFAAEAAVDAELVAVEVAVEFRPDTVAVPVRAGSTDLVDLDDAPATAESTLDAADPDAAPDPDPLRPLQWNLDLTGLEEAAARGDGTGTTVAVLDTSLAAGHRELAGRLVPGWDFVDDRPWLPGDADRQVGDSNHGTHVAGIIAAVTGNGFGIHGAAPGTVVMPVRVITGDGGRSSDVAAGIIWAVDNGADVLNLSLSSESESELVREAIAHAASHGVVVVASAGNIGAGGSREVWPAAYPSVIAVGAVGQDGELWDESNRGHFVDVVAPGVEIVSLAGIDGQYLRATGTSQAAPHVAAVTAMMLSVDPSLTRYRVARILEDTAIDGGPVGFDFRFGHGNLDAAAAVATAVPGVPPPPDALGVIDLSADGVRMDWSRAGFTRTGYEVLRDGEVVASLPRGATHYAVGRPDPALARVFQLRVVADAGRSAPVGLLPPPIGLVATGVVDGVELSWPALPAGASGYVVLRDGAVHLTVPNRPPSSERVSVIDTSAVPGESYRYEVAALQRNGLSGERSVSVVGSPLESTPTG